MGEDMPEDEEDRNNVDMRQVVEERPASSTLASLMTSSLVGLAERITTAIPHLFSASAVDVESTTQFPTTTLTPPTTSTTKKTTTAGTTARTTIKTTTTTSAITTSFTSTATGPATTTAIPATTVGTTEEVVTDFPLDVSEEVGEELGSGSEEERDAADNFQPADTFQPAQTRKRSTRIFKPNRGYFARRKFGERMEGES